jgi:hypothetical protein
VSQVAWLSVFADVPVDRLERAQRFWECATATSAGTPSGAHGEFVPLEPERGDRYLWLQRVERDTTGWHPDLHVRDLDRAVARARDCGARIVRAAEVLVALATPAGQPFCLVREEDPARERPPAPAWDGRRSVADQLCLDIPAGTYESETAFWRALTGGQPSTSGRPEFQRLRPPGELPVQFLLQRLGADDGGVARAHLDMSADDPAAEVARHQSLGATVVRETDGWTTLVDPVGLTYCVTHRTPS